MNIRSWQIFQAVSEKGSFTAAAKSLYISQPAISYAISELEKEIGFPLFDRLTGGIQLTKPGAIYLQKVSTVLKLIEDLKGDTYDNEHYSTLTIGSTITIANYMLMPILKKYTHEVSVPPQVYVLNARTTLQSVQEGKIDVALIEGVVDEKQLLTVPFSSFTLSIYASSSFITANRKTLRFRDLINMPFLLREEGSAIRDTFDSYLRLNNLVVHPLWTSVNSNALIVAAQSGIGLTVLPEELVQQQLRDGSLIKIPLSDFSLNYQTNLVYHKDKYLFENMQTFINIVTTTFRAHHER